MAELSPAAETRLALQHARAHLKTHVAWRTHLGCGGDLPHELIGDLEHQEKAIGELNLVCKVLRRALEHPHE